MKVDVKLDRVTVTGKYSDGRQLIDYAIKHGWVSRVDRDGRVMCLLEREFDNGDKENKAVLLPNPYQKDSWRVDTSNHLTEFEKKRVIKVISQLAGAHWTRVDIAFDFVNGDVEPMKHVITRVGASQAEFRSYDESKIYGRSGRLETIYSGKRASERMIRVYNKLIEQKKHHHMVDSDIKRWERWEVQLRGRKTSEWLDSASEMLDYVKLPVLDKFNLNYRDKSVLLALNCHEISFADIGAKATRAKYRKMQKKNVGYDTHYSELARHVLSKKVDDIYKELNQFLGKLSLEK